jgi:hypothetical protein
MLQGDKVVVSHHFVYQLILLVLLWLCVLVPLSRLKRPVTAPAVPALSESLTPKRLLSHTMPSPRAGRLACRRSALVPGWGSGSSIAPVGLVGGVAPRGTVHIFFTWAKNQRGLTPSTHTMTWAAALNRYSRYRRPGVCCCHPLPWVFSHPSGGSAVGIGSRVTSTRPPLEV